MKVDIYSSGSAGNLVVLNDEVIIDAGVYRPVAGKALLITHHHTDHVKELLKFGGIPVYTVEEVRDKLEGRFPYLSATAVEYGQMFVVKGDDDFYYITPIRLKHDVPCCGFDIVYKDERILYATDFNEIVDHVELSDYTALYLECNNTLNPLCLVDAFFGDDIPKDEFHRRKSFQNHCNADYLIGLFKRCGYSEDNRCEIPLTLMHKSTYYYLANSERIVELCKIANVKNPLL